jgi:hypothetical protein
MAEPHGMTTWNTLPPEVHDAILKFFCQDLIAEYNRKYELFDATGAREAKEASRKSRLTWPAPPQPLVDFSSALRTSRSFYQSLHRLKINGKSPTLELQFLQGYFCLAIGRKAEKKCFRDCGVYMEIAGVFWKNPLILNMKSKVLILIMLVLDHESLIMLVPHMEEWVLSEATPISTHLKEPEPFVYHELGREFAVFETGSLMVPDGPGGSMRSIKGLYVGSEFQAGTDKKPENQSQYILRQTRINE